jgi:hypothetical protein
MMDCFERAVRIPIYVLRVYFFKMLVNVDFSFSLGVSKVIRDDNYAATYQDHRCDYTCHDKKSCMDTFLHFCRCGM